MNAVGPTASTSYELPEYMLEAMGIAALPSYALPRRIHSHARPYSPTCHEQAMTKDPNLRLDASPVAAACIWCDQQDLEPTADAKESSKHEFTKRLLSLMGMARSADMKESTGIRGQALRVWPDNRLQAGHEGRSGAGRREDRSA